MGRGGRWYDAESVRFRSVAEARAYWWSRLLDVAKWAFVALLAIVLVAVVAVLYGAFVNPLIPSPPPIKVPIDPRG